MRVLAAELGVRTVKIVRATEPYAQLETGMSEESFELIRDAVPHNVAEVLRFSPGRGGSISVSLPRGMDTERLAERTFSVLMQMRKALPRFVKYM